MISSLSLALVNPFSVADLCEQDGGLINISLPCVVLQDLL